MSVPVVGGVLTHIAYEPREPRLVGAVVAGVLADLLEGDDVPRLVLKKLLPMASTLMTLAAINGAAAAWLLLLPISS